MINKIYISILVLLLSLAFLPAMGQTDTLCESSPTNNYYVNLTSGSTYQWDTQGDGLINSGQGSASVNITWTNGAGNYSLSVTETSADGCEGLPQILEILVLPELTSTENLIVCASDLPYLWNGQNLSVDGTYTYTTIGSNDCDSTVTLDFTVQ